MTRLGSQQHVSVYYAEQNINQYIFMHKCVVQMDELFPFLESTKQPAITQHNEMLFWFVL
jgi:hypothetical protein